jgi:hypothetical protein
MRGFSFPGLAMPHETPAEAEAVFSVPHVIGKNLTFIAG